MANENTQVIKFCNEQVRVVADLKAQQYYTDKAIVNNWFANNMPAIITSDGTIIDDGAATDGRSPLTGVDVYTIITRAQENIADCEANSNAKLNTILAVAVNTQARF